jgi:hypothetical protein
MEQRINKHVTGVATGLLLARDWRREQEKGNVTGRLSSWLERVNG